MHACFGSIQINCLCEIVRDCCMHNNCIFFKIKLFFFNYLGPWRIFFVNNKRLYQEEREPNEVKSKELSEPFSAIFFFTRLLQSMIFFNFLCFSRYICQERMSSFSLVFALFRRWWKCGYFSLKLQFHVKVLPRRQNFFCECVQSSIYCLLMNLKCGLFSLHCQSPATLILYAV